MIRLFYVTLVFRSNPQPTQTYCPFNVDLNLKKNKLVGFKSQQNSDKPDFRISYALSFTDIDVASVSRQTLHFISTPGLHFG